MKTKGFIIFSLGLFSFIGKAQKVDSLKPSYKFESIVHDFGAIPEGPMATCSFKFINTGNDPIIIESVTSQSGNIQPYWNKKPIAPGQTGEIKAIMMTRGRPGSFTKTITAKLSKGANEYLTLKGFIAAVPDSLKPSYKFESIVHDFGTIKEAEAIYVFKYTNTGIVPLLISDVKVPCGCMTPEWSKEPLAPGKTGSIKIIFNSYGQIGRFSKTTTVNFINGSSEFLTIKGYVNPVPSVKFYDTVHNFGRIPLTKQVSYIFELTNFGDEPISITDAGTSDGGSWINSWTKEPILKDKRGKIEVIYSAYSLGSFSKSVYAKFSNGAWANMTIQGYVTPINFKDTSYNFWNIPLNTPVSHDFEFTNSGTEPIAIIEAYESEPYPPDYSKEPIIKGVNGKIKCSFNAGHIGYFTKIKTVKFSNGETFSLTIYGNVTQYKFNKTVHDFGNISGGPPTTCIFKFTNTGNVSLTLENVMTSSGSVVAEWNKEPIASGKTGEIKITYDTSGSIGCFTKTTTLQFSTGDVEYLTIKGNVEYVPSEPPMIITH